MKTIVYQSFQADETPRWIDRCLETVRDWAMFQGFDYQREDNFFDYVPDWYIEKVQGKINVIADLARLQLAKKFLTEGYDRAIWMDADIVVFDRDRLKVETAENYLVCREVWLDTADGIDLGTGEIFCTQKVTNSLVMFAKNNNFLDFYIDACQSIVKKNTGYLSKLCVSTKFLTKLHELIELPLFHQIGLFSPILMHGIVNNEPEILNLYERSLESPVYAANLCFSFRNKEYKGLSIPDSLFAETIARLIATRGETINQNFVSNIAK
ncbi:MAG: hypothetical protein J7647_17630 [Cyanobacteria bacterium SBLK]|nr:hypothetical protein [Cyanobacteria bacterium SBLK]